MSKMTDVELEQLHVAENATLRLLGNYKSRERKGKDLARLKLLEQAAQCLEAARRL